MIDFSRWHKQQVPWDGKYALSQGIVLEFLGLFRAVRPVLGPSCCRFYPSCTEHAREAVATLGVLRAVPPVLGRLLRCHPLHPGGYDPVQSRGTNAIFCAAPGMRPAS